MQKAICFIIFFFVEFEVFSQSNYLIAERIAYIKQIYSEIEKNVNNYVYSSENKVFFNNNEENSEFNDSKDEDFEDDGILDWTNITRYFDENKNLKMLKYCYEYDDMWLYKKNEIFVYYDSNGLIFIYSKYYNAEDIWKLNSDDGNFSVEENRYYFDEQERCICFLKKEFSGAISQYDSISKLSVNVEQNCTDVDSLKLEIEMLLSEKK